VSVYPKNPVSREYVVNCTASQTKSQVLIATSVIVKTASAGNQWEGKVVRYLSRMCVCSIVINTFSGPLWVQHALLLGDFAN
jgi:ribosomal protein L35AE/L33A